MPFPRYFMSGEFITACGLSLEVAACTDQTINPKIHYTLFIFIKRYPWSKASSISNATMQPSFVRIQTTVEMHFPSELLYSDYVPGDGVFDNSVRLHNYRYDGRRQFSDRGIVMGRKKTRQGETSGRFGRWRWQYFKLWGFESTSWIVAMLDKYYTLLWRSVSWTICNSISNSRQLCYFVFKTTWWQSPHVSHSLLITCLRHWEPYLDIRQRNSGFSCGPMRYWFSTRMAENWDFCPLLRTLFDLQGRETLTRSWEYIETVGKL